MIEKPVDEQFSTYPVALRLAGRRVVVAGGGRIASRRVARLLAAGARVAVIAPRLDPALSERAACGAIEWQQRAVKDSDARDAALCFAATDDADVNARFAAAARARGIPVQRADDAKASDFLVPALVERGPLQVSVSSDAAAPSLTRRLRARLETLVPHAYGDLASLAGEFRAQVKTCVPRAERAGFWNAVFEGPIAEQVFAGRIDAARRELQATLAEADPMKRATRGEVYLVGSGPGDPDLLTFRALRLMQRADVVLYDSLLPASILELVSPEAERIHVGKRASKHTLPQDEINALMVKLAQAGRRVLRLKGGDPFVFGRGGEEISELADAGIPFQIVPGITSANGCAAYAGIPLTHRDYAQSVTFVTGHLKEGELNLSWAELAQRGQTVVFFMGRRNLDTICARLIEHGLPADWPAAMVIDGTTARQRLIPATLTDLPPLVAAERSTGAALLIVGEVVRLHERLGWFHPTAEY
ncbi:siroheme synthase CysG [Salinisphaera hydrothermalis]|uniref:Siroheme synthase n=1 Tax=Salinisphaera hydrothermalis (strain C41B8) TaxID=1304275 RepID=A0A084IQ51_SALHC|nr:siroheme synthase CysG [Salinisphaera hydrothermalis]KEZ78835.1 Uroporphyrinogen-III methyltransferase [Salinisphaera hydrothermalis C41B8]